MILLDTCALLWLNGDRTSFSPAAARALDRSANAIGVSAISLFEIAMKARCGKLTLPFPAAEWFSRMVDRYRLTEFPVTAAIAVQAADLPELHQDPFDRLIIATAREHRLAILTADRLIATYPNLKIIW